MKACQAEEAYAAAQIELDAEEVRRLETLGDETGVHTLRKWEKEMNCNKKRKGDDLERRRSNSCF